MKRMKRKVLRILVILAMASEITKNIAFPDLSQVINSDLLNKAMQTWVIVADKCDGLFNKENNSLLNQTSAQVPIPEYTGTSCTVMNGNTPYFTKADLTLEAFEYYSELDKLGRCQSVYANICLELMPTEERGEIGHIKPSGWHTIKYNGLVDGNYLYNRCHLIGFQLAGENDNKNNLITGTRWLNIEGMLPYENMIADYVENTGNHVLYRVTPMYKGDNLLCHGILMEAYSVEDNGNGICFCVFAHNVQPGIVIDYSTGESHLE